MMTGHVLNVLTVLAIIYMVAAIVFGMGGIELIVWLICAAFLIWRLVTTWRRKRSVAA